METFANDDDGRASKKQITDSADKEHAVVSTEDLLIEILIRLPIFSLYLFKYISKHWLSVIKSPSFTRDYQTRNRYLNIPSGLFVQRRKTQSPGYGYDFISLDDRLSATRYLFHTTFNEAGSNFEIMQSCNGLLLCCIKVLPHKFYVYNPTINMFKMLPQCSTSLDCRMNMVFDPTKSANYKVIHVECIGYNGQIQIYSSETGIWNVCGARRYQKFESFHDGIYCHDAIHWLVSGNGEAFIYKLKIVDEHQVLFSLDLPVAFNGNVHRDCKIFESCGCLLILCRPNTDSWKLRIYARSNASPGWSLKYRVNLDDIINPYLKTRRMPHMWSCSNVWCIVLGEREDDSFLVMEVYGKVVQVNLVSESSCMLCDFGLPSLPHKFQYIPSFASV